VALPLLCRYSAGGSGRVRDTQRLEIPGDRSCPPKGRHGSPDHHSRCLRHRASLTFRTGPWLVLRSVAKDDVARTADIGIQWIRSLGQRQVPTRIAPMSSDTTGTRTPPGLMFVGGHPTLRTARATSSLTELVSDAADADCALVDVASLTPTAHAAARHCSPRFPWSSRPRSVPTC
jgi:hypothetical protein